MSDAPLPPLDRASLALIDSAYAAPASGALVKTSKAELVKRLEALPLEKRAPLMMSLAMAKPIDIMGGAPWPA